MSRIGFRQLSAAALLCVAGIAYAGYGDDRAFIEDLQARYMFAFDYGDPEGYAGTFTPDGVLDYGGGEIKGRKAIAEFIAAGRKRTEEARAKTPPGQQPTVGRHIINNMVINEAIPEWASQYLNPVKTPSPPPKYRAPSGQR